MREDMGVLSRAMVEYAGPAYGYEARRGEARRSEVDPTEL